MTAGAGEEGGAEGGAEGGVGGWDGEGEGEGGESPRGGVYPFEEGEGDGGESPRGYVGQGGESPRWGYSEGFSGDLSEQSFSSTGVGADEVGGKGQDVVGAGEGYSPRPEVHARRAPPYNSQLSSADHYHSPAVSGAPHDPALLHAERSAGGGSMDVAE